MEKEKECPCYRCINCGTPSDSLFKQYGPTVLKLTKCTECLEVVDKYVEYDVVIVMIDLVLISKQAQRHILYNTPFQNFWKLLIIMIMVETYGIWSKGNLINVILSHYCSQDQSFVLSISHKSTFLTETCNVWLKKINSVDPFISEMSFYIATAAVLLSAATFILAIHFGIIIMNKFHRQRQVSVKELLRGMSLGHTSVMLTLPMVIWGTEEDKSISVGFLLAAAYSFYVYCSVVKVIYQRSTTVLLPVVALAFSAKYFVLLSSKTFIHTLF